MKTLEETKKGLKHCSNDAYLCSERCPYFNTQSNGIDCASRLHVDALAYIQQREEREWDLLNLLSSAWFGKQCYFQQNNSTVYSRVSGEYMTLDQAIDEFASELTNERESDPEPYLPKWISVKERLPEEDQKVLVSVNGGFCISYIFGFDMVTGEPEWTYTGLGADPDHWMPLPEPPTEG